MLSYGQTMLAGAAEYNDTLQTLQASGFSASFTQTGGMCAAIEVRLERGYLLVTDAAEELPWTRSAQVGWGVGYYRTDDVSDGPIEYVENEEDCSSEALLVLVRACLSEVAARRNAGSR